MAAASDEESGDCSSEQEFDDCSEEETDEYCSDESGDCSSEEDSGEYSEDDVDFEPVPSSSVADGFHGDDDESKGVAARVRERGVDCLLRHAHDAEALVAWLLGATAAKVSDMGHVCCCCAALARVIFATSGVCVCSSNPRLSSSTGLSSATT